MTEDRWELAGLSLGDTEGAIDSWRREEKWCPLGGDRPQVGKRFSADHCGDPRIVRRLLNRDRRAEPRDGERFPRAQARRESERSNS